jgi:hypothetical protein
VVRTQPREARALWKAGDALVAAQDALLSGKGDAKGLRDAGEREREALDALLAAARGLLTGKGRDLGDATLEKLRDTLHAAAIDPDGREDVAAGRVVKERAHAGLGTFEGALAAAPVREKKPAPPPKEKKEDRAGRRERERAEVEQAEREEAERRQAARRRAAAERELREAEKGLATAEKRAERADARLAEAQEAAEEAGAELDAAQARADNARAALDAIPGGEGS